MIVIDLRKYIFVDKIHNRKLMLCKKGCEKINNKNVISLFILSMELHLYWVAPLI